LEVALGAASVKYRNFRLLARVFAVLAWIVGGGATLLAILVAFQASSGLLSILSIVIGLLFAFFAFAVLYTVSQLIYLVIDVEENTRELRRSQKKDE